MLRERKIKNRYKKRRYALGGNLETVETLEGEFKQWIQEFSDKSIPEIYQLLEKYKDKKIVIFKSREEANLYLENL